MNEHRYRVVAVTLFGKLEAFRFRKDKRSLWFQTSRFYEDLALGLL